MQQIPRVCLAGSLRACRRSHEPHHTLSRECERRAVPIAEEAGEREEANRKPRLLTVRVRRRFAARHAEEAERQVVEARVIAHVLVPECGSKSCLVLLSY